MSFFKKIHFLFTFLLFFFYNNVYAFNITEILNKYPDYSTFNDYLTQTKVAAAINSQGTITVLAVSNANVGSLAGKTNDDLTAIMSVHGILDYLDMKKLQNMKNSSMLTTVYQQTGKAKGKQGFLNVTISSNGNVFFGSSVPGSNLGVKLVDPVFAQPYTISVLQVDGVITPGTASSATNASTTPPSSSPPTPAPASSPGKTPIPIPTPGKSPSKSPSTSPPSPPAPTPATPPGAAPSNATSPPSEAPAPSTAPAPSNATTPSPSPSLSPTLAPAPGPDAAADNPPSLGTHLGHNLGAMSAVILTNVWLFAMF